MGQPKPFLEFGGRPLISWVLDSVVDLCQKVYIVSGSLPEDAFLDRILSFRRDHIEVMRDRLPGCGPLGGMSTALPLTRGPFALVVACDMPFLNPRLLRYLADQLGNFDAAVLQLPGGEHPLPGVYSKTCLTAISQQLMSGDLALASLLGRIRVKRVPEEAIQRFDPRSLSTTNVNTPEDLEKARSLLPYCQVVDGGLAHEP